MATSEQMATLVLANMWGIKEETLDAIYQILIQDLGEERVFSTFELYSISLNKHGYNNWHLDTYSIGIKQFKGENIFDQLPYICEKIQTFLIQKYHIVNGIKTVYIELFEGINVDCEQLGKDFLRGIGLIGETRFIGAYEAISIARNKSM